MRRTGRVRWLALVVLVPVIGWLTACGQQTEPTPGRSVTPGSTAPSKSTTDGLRTDLEPLLSRFGALDSALSAVWCAGTLGDGRAPGPSTYWIDAVVVVDAARAQSWRSLPGLAPAVAAPTVHPELTDRLPAGPLLTGPELDSLLSQDGFVTTAYLAQTTDQVVIVAVGQ